jgi:hypothetical protein
MAVSQAATGAPLFVGNEGVHCRIFQGNTLTNGPGPERGFMKELLSVVFRFTFTGLDHLCGPDCLCWKSDCEDRQFISRGVRKQKKLALANA